MIYNYKYVYIITRLEHDYKRPINRRIGTRIVTSGLLSIDKRKKTFKELLSTKQVAQFLDVNEKMVYALVAEKALPATKVTGKWLFPRHLVEQWIETHTVNYPEAVPSFFILPRINDNRRE